MRCTGPKNVNGGKASVANWCIKTPLPFTRSSGLQNKSSSTLHVVARVTFLVSIGVLSDHATKPLAICIGVVTAALLQATRYNATNHKKLSNVKTNNSKKQQSYKQFVIPQSYHHLSYQSPFAIAKLTCFRAFIAPSRNSSHLTSGPAPGTRK